MRDLPAKLLLGRPWRQAALATSALLVLLFGVTSRLGAYDALRERAFDVMLARLGPPVPPVRVRVVDIDRQSLERMGPWPWSREQLAGLVGDVLAAGPVAVGVDILIEGLDERSPAALARRLAELTGDEGARKLAASLPDGDAQFAAVIRNKPVALGLALDPERPSEPPPMAPILVQGAIDVSGIWQALGVAGPPKAIAEAAAGLGVLALSGDADGRIRRVPLLTATEDQLRPGLALETARTAVQASAYVLARDNVLRTGRLVVPFSADASLRLLPPFNDVMASRTIAATNVATASARAEMAGSVVMIGSSAPELGGLRLASGGELVPSVQRQATAVSQLLARINPRRPIAIDLHEGLALLLAAAAGLTAALRAQPVKAGVVVAVLALGWLGLTWEALKGWQVLLDPVAVPVAVLGSFGLSSLIVEADQRRRQAALRRRFEQHLAPELVSRIAQDPSLLKLAGETRVASILFTDVEGFTAMTERSDPTLLIRVLDRYIDEMSAIIVAHGGMVEKIVGDGFHGLFNAPLDLPQHADKAVACAIAIRDFSLRFAAEPEPSALGFGRTRVGIETGPVIVGDVGGGTRLDYTAYGNAMNTAARLEAANKDLGSAICIGPGTSAMLSDRTMLRPLGRLYVRGRSEPMEICDVWPDAMNAEQRAAFSDAMAEARPADGAIALARLAADLPDDVALARLVERLSNTSSRDIRL